MANVYSNNNILLNSAGDWGIMIYDFVQFLVTNGVFEILGSGDGTSTYENTGETAGPYDVIASVDTYASGGAGSWSNTNAWYRVRIVGTTKEFVIVRFTAAGNQYHGHYMIAYSPTGFDGADATNTAPPTCNADDAVPAIGDCDPDGTVVSHGQLHYSANITGDLRYHFWCDTTAQEGIFPFYYAANRFSDALHSGFWMMDSFEDRIAGDARPEFTFAGRTNSGPTRVNLNSWAICYRAVGATPDYEAKGPGQSGTVHTAVVYDGSTWIFPGGVPVQVVDSATRSFPIYCGDPDLGWMKGKLRNFVWKGPTSGYPDTADLATVGAKIFWEDLLMPWEQNVTPE